MLRESRLPRPSARACSAPRPSAPICGDTPFLCTLAAGGTWAAWVHLAGELDLLTAPRLAGTLAEARSCAHLTVLDARRVTFIDSAGVHALKDASRACEDAAGRLLVVPSPAIERILGIGDLGDGISTFDLSPEEPDPALRLT